MEELQNRIWRVALRLAYRMALVYWWLFRPQETSVNVAIWWEGRVLTIRNSYKREVTFPGGRGKRGEALKESAARELLEEVGIAVAPEHLDFAGIFVSTVERKEDQSHFFSVELLEEPKVTLDQREVIAAEFLTAEEALNHSLGDPVRQYLENLATPGKLQ